MKTKQLFSAQPLIYPTPLLPGFTSAHAGKLKHLGVSPAIDNGIRYWRVIWRPFLKEPIHYRDARGRPRVKNKEDNVRTERYAVVKGYEEREIYQLAVLKAKEVYRLDGRIANLEPRVDWEMLAKTMGEIILPEFTRKSLNDGVLEKAAKLFSEGQSNSMVAKAFDVDRSTASRWRKKVRSV